MKLLAFAALFLHATITLPDAAMRIAPGYCIIRPTTEVFDPVTYLRSAAQTLRELRKDEIS